MLSLRQNPNKTSAPSGSVSALFLCSPAMQTCFDLCHYWANEMVLWGALWGFTLAAWPRSFWTLSEILQLPAVVFISYTTSSSECTWHQISHIHTHSCILSQTVSVNTHIQNSCCPLALCGEASFAVCSLLWPDYLSVQTLLLHTTV